MIKITQRPKLWARPTDSAACQGTEHRPGQEINTAEVKGADLPWQRLALGRQSALL
jgi:hypothetical protein